MPDDIGLIIILCQAIGVTGFFLYIGVYALVSWRIISGDSLIFFAGNTLAATLVLASNYAAFNLASVLIQIFFIIIGMTAMILCFLKDTAQERN